MKRSLFFILPFLLLFAWATSPAFSQDDPPQTPAAPAALKPADPPAPVDPAPAATPSEAPTLKPQPLPPRETSTSPATANESNVVREEKSIYVPYEDLEAIFENEGRGVFLPYKEFLDLWNQLNIEKKKEDEKPPADGVVASAQYSATVEGTEDKVLAIDATLEVESFKDKGWAVVPLIKSGLHIADADTGEATLHLGKNGYELILPRKGQYQIQLKLYAKINRSAGRNTVGINLPKAGVSRFDAILPEQGWDFELNPSAAYSSEKVGEDQTRLSFFFGETEHFDLTWQKQGEETKLTPLLFVESALTSKVVPGAVQSDLTLDYRILRSGVEEFEVTVPSEQEILNVSGENIREWDVMDTGDDQKLTVSLHSPAKQNYSLKLTLEEALESLPTEFPLPQIQAENVVRQRGNVTVQTSRELEVETVSSEGLTQQSLSGQNAKGTDEALRPYGRFRYLGLPFDLTLAVKKAEPVIEVESFTRFNIQPDFSNFLTSFKYNVKRVGIFDTRIEIPADFEGVEATGEQVDDFSEETDADGNRILTVTFKNRVEGAITFSVNGRLIRENNDDDALVPVFEPLNVSRHDGKVGLEIHTSLDPKTEEEGDLRQQDVSLLGDNVPGSGPLQIGFRYRGEAAPARIGFTLKKSQITGEIFTLVEVREQLIRYQWTISYNVLYAGIDTFVIAVPEAIADNLRHDGPLIQEVNKNYSPPEGEENPPIAGEGEVLWAVILRDKKMGNYQLTLTLDEPISSISLTEDTPAAETEGADTSQNFPVALPEITLKNVQTESGQIAVVKDDNLEILDADTTSLESIDPKELSGGLARAGVFLSYKYRRHPLALELEVSRNQFLPVPQAVVTYANLTSVLSSDEAITSEVVYWVKNNARQFFSVTLPEGGKMVSDIYVNGQPQQPMSRANEDVVLIRLPVGENQSATEFPVRFIYEIPSPNPGDQLGWIGSAKIPSAELIDAEILQSRLTLFLPNDYVYRKFKSAMRLPVQERGWQRKRERYFDWLIPTLGPQIQTGVDGVWSDPKPLPAGQSGGFDLEIPKEGISYTLNRLDAPAPVTVSYRSKGFALFVEAFVALLAFCVGLYLILYPLRLRLIYFAVAGLLPLIIAGSVSPTSASFWTAIYLGTFFAAIIWLLRGIPGFLRKVWGKIKSLKPKRKKKKKEKTKPVPPEVPNKDSE